MLNALTLLMNLKNDRRGVTAVEYGMIAAMIAVAIVALVGALGTQVGRDVQRGDHRDYARRPPLRTGRGPSPRSWSTPPHVTGSPLLSPMVA